MKQFKASLLPFLVFAYIGFFLLQKPTMQTSIPVLCYHHIKDDTIWHSPDYTISTEAFTSHMKMLRDSGYNPVLPQQLYDHLTSGTDLPPRPVIITFDDGHLEHYTKAMPVLQRFGFKGVFFVPTYIIGKKGFMNDSQLKQLSDSGHVIACHTQTHPEMRKLSDQEKLVQIQGSKSVLEKITGTKIIAFAYPYGAWDDQQ